MNKLLVVILGVSLIVASVAIFAYHSLEASPPYLGSVDGQSDVGDYVVFLCFGLGGGRLGFADCVHAAGRDDPSHLARQNRGGYRGGSGSETRV